MRKLAFIVAGCLSAQSVPGFAQTALPDALDIFVGPPGGKSNVLVLLDASSSMNGNPKASACSWYAANYTGGDTTLKQIDQLKSTMVGCRTATDGIIDRYHSTVNLAIRLLQSPMAPPLSLTVPWGLDAATAQDRTLAISVSGGGNTPMTEGFWAGARDYDLYWTGDNTYECAKNLVVLVADGNSNGSPFTFNQECSGTVAPVTVRASNPEDAAKYLAAGDQLCRVGGAQPITTYTIGIDPNGGAIAQMQLIAQKGGGKYYNALNQEGLSAAFETILRSIVQRSAVFYAAPTVSRDSFFAGRFSYVTSFRPTDKGPWSGNLKKLCTFPRRLTSGRYDPTDLDCMLKSAADGETLYTNPAAKDVWTGDRTQETERGGIGAMMATLGAAPNVGSINAAPTSIRPRNIVTWRPGTAELVAVQPDAWSADDAWMLGEDRWRLINRLHGYTWDWTGARGDPELVARWPYADSVHGSTVLLRYGEDCESAGQCWLVSTTNDGELHFLDAATGEESTALVPAELWRPSGITLHQLKDLNDQPTIEFGHRYFLDGAIRIFHEDTDGDGVIDPSETAFMIFGLGRAGRAYYLVPINTFDGRLSAERNPIRPLFYRPGTPFEELRYTWAAPWLGLADLDGQTRRVAIFPSGHIPELDIASAPTPSWVPGPDTITPISSPHANETPGAIIGASCDFYSATGYPDPLPSDETYGPFSINDAIAYRLHFSAFDLAAGDRLELENAQGIDAAALTGAGVPASVAPWMGTFSLAGNGMWSPWIHDTSIGVRLVTDGITTTNRGYRIDRIEYLKRTPGPRAPHYPTIFVVDVERWNGEAPKAFTAEPDGGAILVRIAKRCPHDAGDDSVCIDETRAPALAAMTCPVTAEVSVYTSADRMSRLYWGDECGQIWVADAPRDGQAPTEWRVRRLASLNDADFTDQAVAAGLSKDLRKIYRKLDLVPSTCPGERVVGVYFGTGNVQRPTARDELLSPALNSGRDVIGVVWDDGATSDVHTAGLADVTSVDAIDPKVIRRAGKHGWYMQLPDDERMLRDPLVFEGRAYFKTHLATAPAGFCTVSSGLDRIYVMNNCTAEATSDVNANGVLARDDRRAWQGSSDVGSDLLVATPLDAPPLISHANLLVSEPAQLGSNQRRPMKILRWWRPR
ncbi:hypothetical protein L6R52_02305 [Myxococcota bacterium]|nr:hypothetical protein [Myxococcota bacterium]